MRQALEQARTAPAPIDRTARICAVGGEHVQLHPGGLRLDPGSCAASHRHADAPAKLTPPAHGTPRYRPPTSRTGVSARANVSDGPIDSPRGIGDQVTRAAERGTRFLLGLAEVCGTGRSRYFLSLTGAWPRALTPTAP